MTTEERIKEQSEFKKEISKMTKEQLENEFNKILEESKKFDEEVSNLTFKLAKTNKKINQKEVFDNIKYFLNKQKVKWNYALSLIELYEFFAIEQKEIKFYTLDAVLRSLGQLEYEGYSEWCKVSTINTYFSNISEKYKEVTDKIYNLAEKYSMVDSQLKLFEHTVPDEEFKKDCECTCNK